MKTDLAHDNPFRTGKLNWAYGSEFIEDGARVLDYGCFDGSCLRRLKRLPEDQTAEAVMGLAESTLRRTETVLCRTQEDGLSDLSVRWQNRTDV